MTSAGIWDATACRRCVPLISMRLPSMVNALRTASVPHLSVVHPGQYYGPAVIRMGTVWSVLHTLDSKIICMTRNVTSLGYSPMQVTARISLTTSTSRPIPDALDRPFIGKVDVGFILEHT